MQLSKHKLAEARKRVAEAEKHLADLKACPARSTMHACPRQRVGAPARSATHSGRGSWGQHVADNTRLASYQACYKQGCVAIPAAARERERSWPISLKWPATSCVIRKRRMPTPDPPVHDLAPVPMRAGTRIGTTTRLLRRARAQGDCGCALSDAWFSECRFHADCGIVRDGALAAARCGFV